MLNRLNSIRIGRAPRQIGVLATYFVSMLVLAIGISLLYWMETRQERAWVWLVIAAGALTGEVWVHSKARTRQSIEVPAIIFVGLIWAVPIILWFDGMSQESKLLLVIFYGLIALCGVLLKRNGMLRTLLTVGVSLPCVIFMLWRSNGHSFTYASLAVLAVWLIILCLGWLIGWSNAQRRQFVSQRELLLAKLESKMHELDLARSEEMKARTAADQANRDKSKFLAMVSHDLRQPIYAANLMIESVQYGEDQKVSKSNLLQIQNSLTELTVFLEALLDSAMLDSGELTANPSVFSLERIALQLQADYVEMGAQKGLDVQIDLPNVNVTTDHVLLGRVLRNLVSNAIYHSQGSIVKVFYAQSGDHISLVVEDDGCGLPAEVQVAFAENTLIANANTSSSHKDSHGLGLTIVKRFCDMLGLDLRLGDSESGTRFELGGLIICDNSVETKTGAQDKNDDDPQTILLIDDDDVILDQLTGLLARWGYHVHGSTGQLPNILRPDLLIADFDLSAKQNGVDLIEEARARWGRELPAFIMTGNTSKDVVSQVHAAGLRVVNKPIQPAALKSIILTELSQQRMGI